MEQSNEKRLHELLVDFRTGILVTRTTAGDLRGRPMLIAKVDSDDTLWFATSIVSGKVDEVLSEPHVGVTLQDMRHFVSITGEAEIVRDRAKVNEFWNESWKVWFPNGKDDPELALIRVTTKRGEFWDLETGNRLKYLYEAAKAYVTGTKPKDLKEIHGTVENGSSVARPSPAR